MIHHRNLGSGVCIHLAGSSSSECSCLVLGWRPHRWWERQRYWYGLGPQLRPTYRLGGAIVAHRRSEIIHAP